MNISNVEKLINNISLNLKMDDILPNNKSSYIRAIYNWKGEIQKLTHNELLKFKLALVKLHSKSITKLEPLVIFRLVNVIHRGGVLKDLKLSDLINFTDYLTAEYFVPAVGNLPVSTFHKVFRLNKNMELDTKNVESIFDKEAYGFPRSEGHEVIHKLQEAILVHLSDLSVNEKNEINGELPPIRNFMYPEDDTRKHRVSIPYTAKENEFYSFQISNIVSNLASIVSGNCDLSIDDFFLLFMVSSINYASPYMLVDIRPSNESIFMKFTDSDNRELRIAHAPRFDTDLTEYILLHALPLYLHLDTESLDKARMLFKEEIDSALDITKEQLVERLQRYVPTRIESMITKNPLTDAFGFLGNNINALLGTIYPLLPNHTEYIQSVFKAILQYIKESSKTGTVTVTCYNAITDQFITALTMRRDIPYLNSVTASKARYSLEKGEFVSRNILEENHTELLQLLYYTKEIDKYLTTEVKEEILTIMKLHNSTITEFKRKFPMIPDRYFKSLIHING